MEERGGDKIIVILIMNGVTNKRIIMKKLTSSSMGGEPYANVG